MGYDGGVLKDEKSPIWDFQEGYDDDFETWKASLDPQSWMKYSCVWYAKLLALQLGQEKVQNYLTLFEYGNQDLSAGLVPPGPKDPPWINSSLKISPKEQVDFIQKMLLKKLPISNHALQMAQKILFKEILPQGWKLFGKTGSSGSDIARDGKTLEFGWFVGWIEKEHSVFPFAYLIRGQKIDFDQRVPRVKQLLLESEIMKEDGNRNQNGTLPAIHSKVLETISYSQEIPGLKSEEFPALKGEISRLWNSLSQEGAVEICGTDKEIRPLFVALQAVIEHALAAALQKEIRTLKGVIHTPMPATPLCTKGAISKELVSPSIEIDPIRLFTVKARATIVRDYLFKGGELYIAYPKQGWYQRTEEQQAIYGQELMNFPTHLFDVPLNCVSIPDDLIGATYLFQDQLGKLFVFAIKMTQAKDPKAMGNFGLWFGSIDTPVIQERLDAVSSYLEQNGLDLLRVKKKILSSKL